MLIKHCFVLLFTLAATELAVADCNTAIPKATPDNAFTVYNNGTVTHNKTGLMWMRCELGQTWDGTTSTCGGTSQGYQWSAALQAADGYAFAGYSDWRLPNKNELASIVEWACINPAINTLVFPNIPNSLCLVFVAVCLLFEPCVERGLLQWRCWQKWGLLRRPRSLGARRTVIFGFFAVVVTGKMEPGIGSAGCQTRAEALIELENCVAFRPGCADIDGIAGFLWHQYRHHSRIAGPLQLWTH